MAGKISQYPSAITTLASGDLFDVSEFLNPGYESKKLDWSTLLTELNSQITFANIYTTDGTTTGERTISIGTNDLIFGSTGDVDLLRFDATADRIGIGIAAPNEKLHVNGNSQLAGQLSVNDNVNADVQMLLSTTLRDGINVGNTNSTGTQSSSIIGRNLSTHASGQATALRGTVQNNTTSGINVAVEGRALSTGTNYGAWFEAIGGSNNYALITGGGDVGIGTTTPSQKLEVVGNTKINGTTFISVSGGINALEVRSFNSAVLGLVQDNNANVIHEKYSHFKNSLTLGDTITTPVDRLHLDQDWEIYVGTTGNYSRISNTNSTFFGLGQNVGIGTTTPTQKLDVVGNINVNDFYIDNVKHIELGGVAGTTQPFIRFFTTANAFNAAVGTNQGVSYGLGDGVNDLAIRNDLGKIFFGRNGAGNNMVFNPSNGGLGIGTATPTEKLEVAGNAKFSGTTYLNSSSIIGQTDNGDLAVGSNGNIGFVKKSGSFGVMAVGSTSNFVVRVSSSSNLAGTTAASTFTDIYHQENDTNVRIGRNDIAFRVDDDNGGVDPLDTLAQFQINTRSKTSITVDTLGRTTLGGTTANAEVILNTNDSTAIAAGLMVKNITGAQILALTPSNGMIAYATSTSGAISSVGFWGYENGAWVKL